MGNGRKKKIISHERKEKRLLLLSSVVGVPKDPEIECRKIFKFFFSLFRLENLLEGRKAGQQQQQHQETTKPTNYDVITE